MNTYFLVTYTMWDLSVEHLNQDNRSTFYPMSPGLDDYYAISIIALLECLAKI